MIDYLRPEAGPIPYKKHHKRARAALDKIIKALNSAVNSTQSQSDDDFVDTNRANRIFFVSGEPGSGQSTLYLTLRKMLGKNGTTFGEGCKEPLDNLKKGIRWLDTLDLEVAGDEGENLLAAVLVRVIEELTNQEITTHSKSCQDAIKDLEELATSIGIAWEGNLQARAGQLDPDTYSEEVMRTQRARLGINTRLKKVLDKLADNLCFSCNENTLFVLPVDDFYLKPDVSLELLRLLRMISIPRLFFLVMGDITTVEALFVEKSLADWTAVAGPEIFATLKERQDEVLGRARELRARYLRKLLPPGQRAEIEVMDWYEAMHFQPKPLDNKRGGNVQLRGLLAKVDLDQPLSSKTNLSEKQNPPHGEFLEFLTCRRLGDSTSEQLNHVGNEKGDEKYAREAYTGLQLFDATPREIMDLWIDFQKLTQDTKPDNVIKQNSEASQFPFPNYDEDSNDVPSPPLLSLVLKFAKLIIDEQNFLSEALQEELFKVFPTRHYYTPDTFLEMNRLCIGREANSWKDENKVILKPFEIRIRKHSRWKLIVVDTTSEMLEEEDAINEKQSDISLTRRKPEQDPFDKLPPRPTAWIILLHDLAWLWSSESMNQNLVEQLLERLRQNSSEQAVSNSLPDFGWAIWKQEPKSEWNHFPFPKFQTFQELDRLLMVWNTGFDWWQKKKADKSSLQLTEELVNLWELSCLIVVDNDYDKFALRDENWFEKELKNIQLSSSVKTKQFDESTSFDKWRKEMNDFRSIIFSDQLKKLNTVEKTGKSKR